MRQSMAMVLGTVCLAGLLSASLSLTMRADEPAKKAQAVKPSWQRYLQGEDDKKAAQQEKKLVQLQEAGQFAEALKVAEELAELRSKVQGADHWQAANARLEVEAIRCVLRANKEDQQRYANTLAAKREADTLTAKSRYREAQPLLEQILAVRRKVLGEDHPDTAKSYSNLAYCLEHRGKAQEAENGSRKALAIFRNALGEEHPLTAIGYNNLAKNQEAQGKHQEAEKGLRTALAIFLRALGEEHADTARAYNNLAQNLEAQSKKIEAEEFYRKSLAVRIKILGEDNPEVAISYNNLAALRHRLGKHHEAEEGYRKALAICRKVLGEEHLTTASIYSNLADHVDSLDRYGEAEEGFRKALSIRRKLLGEEHLDTAASYNLAARNLHLQGKFQLAEEGLRKALAIRRKILGEENLDTAQSYQNVAVNMIFQGKSLQAEELLRRCLAIRRKLLGEDHAGTAYSYHFLAYSLNTQGKRADAEQIHLKSLAIFRKVLGEEHREMAAVYNNLGLNLNDQGKYQEAETFFRKALSIWIKVRGEEHYDTASGYHNVAYNLAAQGKHAEAEENYRKALARRRKVLDEGHPSIATNYDRLADALHAQGKYEEAEKLLNRAAESFAQARLRVAATGLERAAFASSNSPLPLFAAVLARNGKPEEAWQRLEGNLARGTRDDFSARLRRPQAERDKQTQINADIERLNQLIAGINTNKLTLQQAQQRDEWLSQLHHAYDELAAFTQQLETKYGPVAGQVFSRARIQAALPLDAALVAWLDIAGQPKAADPNGEHWAILLRSKGDPVWVRVPGSGDKGAWTDADTQLTPRLREALRSPRGLWQPLAERLRKQRLDPLDQYLKGVHRLIVLPSAALAGVPVEVIAEGYTVSYAHSGSMYVHLRQQQPLTGKGLFALADPVFHTTPVGEKSQSLPPRGVLLTMVLPGSNAFRAGLRANDVMLRYGDVELNAPTDFKPQPESSDPEKSVPVIVWRDGEERKRPTFVRPGKLGVAIAKEPAPQAVAEQRRLDRLFASRGDGDWQELPGTRIEAAALQRLFGASSRLLQKSEASEQRLNELAASGELGKYRYIHLATHGEVNNVMPLRSAVILARDHLPDEKQRTELLLSGQPIPDGRLEADEALRRWHLHADLVTLSACQTALGKYERGEGFVGFAQALILCGTRSVCLSLWEVKDISTALLMVRLYQNLLGKRAGLKAPMPKAAALAEAKAWLRTLPRDEVVKRAASLTEGDSRGKSAAKLPSREVPPAVAKGKTDDCPFAHPHYWAAFILSGDAD